LREADLLALLHHADPHVRIWAIRLLTDAGVAGPAQSLTGLELGTLPSQIVRPLVELAGHEQDPLVLIYLASAMRLMTPDDRWAMAKCLVPHGQFAEDRVYPYLVWYGLEPSIPVHADRIGELLNINRLPTIDRFIARRLAIESTFRNQVLDRLMAHLIDTQLDPRDRHSLLQGLAEGWQGWTDLPTPPHWETVQQFGQTDPEVAVQLTALAPVFAVGRTLGQQTALVADEAQSLELRQSVMRAIVSHLNATPAQDWTAEHAAAVDLLAQLLQHRFLAAAAARALGQWNEPSATDRLLVGFPQAPAAGQTAIIETLCQRPARALELLRAIDRQTIPRTAVTSHQLRQLQLLDQPELSHWIARLWRDSPSLLGQSEQDQIQTLQRLLTPEKLQHGDLARGQVVYQQQCGQCHRLFGQGATLGPELTGGQRGNLNYWLQNIVAPSAEVSSEYRLSLLVLHDGRSLSGVVTQRTPASLVLVSQDQSQLIQWEDVEEIRGLNQSLMPTGLLDALTDDDKVHLFHYLMHQAN
jgi:putative heme-binding domain-containing protein